MRTKGFPSAVPPQFAGGTCSGALTSPTGSSFSSRSRICCNGHTRADLLSRRSFCFVLFVPDQALDRSDRSAASHPDDIRRWGSVEAFSLWRSFSTSLPTPTPPGGVLELFRQLYLNNLHPRPEKGRLFWIWRFPKTRKGKEFAVVPGEYAAGDRLKTVLTSKFTIMSNFLAFHLSLCYPFLTLVRVRGYFVGRAAPVPSMES